MSTDREELYDDFVLQTHGGLGVAELLCTTCTDTFGASKVLGAVKMRTTLTELLAIADAHMEEITE